jgi:microsomal dipeptidase-like Zn-dependent dipeptidase
MNMLKKLGLGLALLLLLAVLALRTVLPGRIEAGTNTVAEHPPYPVSAANGELHRGLTILDWHTDTLLWERDFLQRSDRGHVDLPRLQEGNVAVTVFTAPTRAPAGQNIDANDADTADMLTGLVIVQGWPVRTWGSLLQRALHQADRLRGFVAAAPQQLRWINNAADLRHLLQERELARAAGKAAPVGVLMGTEGSHALEGQVDNVDLLFAAGFRMMSLQHFFDNRLGGSLHGREKPGLSALGRAVVQRIHEREIILDVAHSSPAVVRDVLAMSERPLVVSHTGVHGVCASARNFSDELMREIAGAGGLIAIGYWEAAVCDITPQGVAAAIAYAVNLVGEDHVALGSDFDGGTHTAFDTSELAALTQALVDAGLSDTVIAKVMGENSVAFLLRWLPPGRAAGA